MLKRPIGTELDILLLSLGTIRFTCDDISGRTFTSYLVCNNETHRSICRTTCRNKVIPSTCLFVRHPNLYSRRTVLPSWLCFPLVFFILNSFHLSSLLRLVSFTSLHRLLLLFFVNAVESSIDNRTVPDSLQETFKYTTSRLEIKHWQKLLSRKILH